MSYEFFTGDRERVEDRLNAARAIGPYPTEGLPIGALTLIIDVTTITFGGSAGDYRTFAQMVADIKAAAVPGLVVTSRAANNGAQYSSSPSNGPPSQQRAIVLGNPAGFTIDKDGTANPLLRLPTAADTIIPAAPAPADVLHMSQGSTPAMYFVLIHH